MPSRPSDCRYPLASKYLFLRRTRAKMVRPFRCHRVRSVLQIVKQRSNFVSKPNAGFNRPREDCHGVECDGSPSRGDSDP